MNARHERAMTDGEAAGFEAFERHVRDRAVRELRPDPAVVDRVRIVATGAYRAAMAERGEPAVTESAWAAGAGTQGPGRAGPGAIADWRPAPRPSAGRRSAVRRGVLIAACAATLAVASVAGPAWVFASESVPGHALYSVRIAAETIGLRAIGTPERATAEAARLRTRVGELREEAGRGDWGGAAAALDAARSQARELDRALAAAPGSRSEVRAALADTRRDLESLERTRDLPGEIRAGGRALERDLDRSVLGRDRGWTARPPQRP
jgi:hypothetical protein